MQLILLILVLVIGGLAFVRFAPSDPARWHLPITATTSKDMTGGAIRVTEMQADTFEHVAAAALALARTKRIAGSVEQGRVTYVTRSKWIGFPDYTTIEFSDGALKMHARLRFGRSDFGVNRERLERLLRVAKKE